MLDLFAGRLGWSKAFLARGWEVIAVDLVAPPEWPKGVWFQQQDVRSLRFEKALGGFWFESLTGAKDFNVDFICASPPCEQFSIHGMKHFHPNPKYPAVGIKLFNHTRLICEASGVPYVIENVRAAQQFVGKAVHHCGPFYLWGNGVPPILPQGLEKGMRRGNTAMYKVLAGKERSAYRAANSGPGRDGFSHSRERVEEKARAATIPPELANCVAEYAERICPAVSV